MLRIALGALLALSINITPIQAETLEATNLTQSQYRQLIYTADRTAADLQQDKSRLPIKLLTFMQLKQGMTVFEQGASGGYTTELLARAVGKNGRVYAEGLNPGRFDDGQFPQVKPLERGLIYQIPERAAKAGLNAGQADVIVMMFTYHDLALNPRINRKNMLQNFKQLLKPNGIIIVADNAAIEGSGLEYTPQLHRIDPQLVINEFIDAGFKLMAQSDIYHNPQDDLKAHWRFLAKPRHHHRMLLKFSL